MIDIHILQKPNLLSTIVILLHYFTNMKNYDLSHEQRGDSKSYETLLSISCVKNVDISGRSLRHDNVKISQYTRKIDYQNRQVSVVDGHACICIIDKIHLLLDL